MRRTVLLILLVGTAVCAALWLLLQIPGSLGETLSKPIASIRGTQKRLNLTLLEASETTEPMRAAGRRLLQPLGMVRLVRIYESPEPTPPKRR